MAQIEEQLELDQIRGKSCKSKNKDAIKLTGVKDNDEGIRQNLIITITTEIKHKFLFMLLNQE